MEIKASLSGEEEYDELIGGIRKLAKFVSIWPCEIEDVNGDIVRLRKARQLQSFHRVFMFFYMTSMAVVTSLDAIRNWGDMDKVAECCIPGSSYLLTMWRMLLYGNQQKNIIMVVEMIENDWASASHGDRAILRKKCGPSFKISKYFSLSAALAIVTSCSSPVVQVVFLGEDEWALPYGGYFGVEVPSLSLTYYCICAIQLIGALYGLGNVCATNSFNFISITHASAKFVILQNHLAALRSNGKKSTAALRLCIREHQRAIEFADTLEEVINKVALGQFIISTGLVCFVGLEISAMMDQKLLLGRWLVYLTAAIFELFLFSYSGCELTAQSELVGSAAYNSDWVGGSFTKNLQLMMMRATKPNTITAAKFYDMSLESFTMVLSTSFSYFTTLRAVNE